VPCFRDQERFAHCEAPEEATGVVLLDACAGVEFQEQPAKIQYEWLGEIRDHYPDCLVVTGAHKEFWEFKKDHEVEDVFFRRRAERVAKLLASLGFAYRLVSARYLMQAAYYRNAIEMRRHAKQLAKYPNWLVHLSARMTGKAPETAQVALAFLPQEQRLAALHSCLYNGILVTDLSVAISLESYVHPPPRTGGGMPWVWELFEKSS